MSASVEMSSFGFSTSRTIRSPSRTATPNRDGSSTCLTHATTSESSRFTPGSMKNRVSAKTTMPSPSRCAPAQETACAVPSAGDCTAKLALAPWREQMSVSASRTSCPKSGPRMNTPSVMGRGSTAEKVSTIRSTMLLPHTGSRGLGVTWEWGRTRVPRPAMGMMSFIGAAGACFSDGEAQR